MRGIAKIWAKPIIAAPTACIPTSRTRNGTRNVQIMTKAIIPSGINLSESKDLRVMFFRQQIIHPSELFISDVSSVVSALEFSHPRTIISPEANFSVNVDDLLPTKALNFPYLLFQKRP